MIVSSLNNTTRLLKASRSHSRNSWRRKTHNHTVWITSHRSPLVFADLLAIPEKRPQRSAFKFELDANGSPKLPPLLDWTHTHVACQEVLRNFLKETYSEDAFINCCYYCEHKLKYFIGHQTGLAKLSFRSLEQNPSDLLSDTSCLPFVVGDPSKITANQFKCIYNHWTLRRQCGQQPLIFKGSTKQGFQSETKGFESDDMELDNNDSHSTDAQAASDDDQPLRDDASHDDITMTDEVTMLLTTSQIPGIPFLQHMNDLPFTGLQILGAGVPPQSKKGYVIFLCSTYQLKVSITHADSW